MQTQEERVFSLFYKLYYEDKECCHAENITGSEQHKSVKQLVRERERERDLLLSKSQAKEQTCKKPAGNTALLHILWLARWVPAEQQTDFDVTTGQRVVSDKNLVCAVLIRYKALFDGGVEACLPQELLYDGLKDGRVP